MVFSLGIEILNMRFRKKTAPVVLHPRFEGESAAAAATQAKVGEGSNR
jgi:hypothetical protein